MCNCNKRGRLIGAGVKAVIQGRSAAPAIRSISRTVSRDLSKLRQALTRTPTRSPR